MPIRYPPGTILAAWCLLSCEILSMILHSTLVIHRLVPNKVTDQGLSETVPDRSDAMPPAYESGRAVITPWWLYVLLWIGFAGSLALIPATSHLFAHWGGNGSGALPWVWIVPALGSLITLAVLAAKRNELKLAAEYETR